MIASEPRLAGDSEEAIPVMVLRFRILNEIIVYEKKLGVTVLAVFRKRARECERRCAWHLQAVGSPQGGTADCCP